MVFIWHIQGVNDTDLIIYVTLFNEKFNPYAAFASGCVFDED